MISFVFSVMFNDKKEKRIVGQLDPKMIEYAAKDPDIKGLPNEKVLAAFLTAYCLFQQQSASGNVNEMIVNVK